MNGTAFVIKVANYVTGEIPMANQSKKLNGIGLLSLAVLQKYVGNTLSRVQRCTPRGFYRHNSVKIERGTIDTQLELLREQ